MAEILALLNPPGEETRVVGGAVRAALMGLEAADFDLATTLLPADVMERAAQAGIKAIPTGLSHGTVTLMLVGQAFEITTLREDIATDGRHAIVRFGRNFIADALRRDFTINALSVSSDGRLHDYVGGEADIAARRVRFIGAAAQRIAEDHLRALRFFRFHAAFGDGPPDAEAMAAIIAARAGLMTLSRERVRAEFMKLLAARKAADATQVIADAGLFSLLLGGVTTSARLARLVSRAGAEADAVLRLAALAVMVIEDAERLRQKLRLSNDEYERLRAAAEVTASLYGTKAPPSRHKMQALMLAHGGRAMRDGLWLGEASWPDADWRIARAELARLPQPRLPFSGEDLQKQGISNGPQMGAMLKTLQADWIRAGFPREPAELARLLAAVVSPK